MKIAVAGTGYVGLSIATLLAQHNEVTAVDIVPEKVEMLNRRQSPIQDEWIEKFLNGEGVNGERLTLNLKATLDAEAAYRDAEYVVIAAPTNYDSRLNYFDTSAVENVIETVIRVNPKAIMVIRKACVRNTSVRTSSSRRSSYVRARRFMTTFIRVVSL